MSKMNWCVGDPHYRTKIECPYCKGSMNLVGPENTVRKKWLKRGVSIAKHLGKTKLPLYICKDEDCGGIFVHEANVIGGHLKPGIYKI